MESSSYSLLVEVSRSGGANFKGMKKDVKVLVALLGFAELGRMVRLFINRSWE